MLRVCAEFGMDSINVGTDDISKWGNPSPVVMAMCNGSVAVLETLLKLGAAATNSYPLHALASSKSEIDSRHIECIKIILAAGTKPNNVKPHNLFNVVSYRGFNVVQAAALRGNHQLMKLAAEYIAAGGSTALKNAHVETGKCLNALSMAASKGHFDCVLVALDDLKFPIAAESNSRPGWQAVHFAAAAGHDRIVDLLANRGADLNAATYDGHTPASLATKSGYSSVLSVLKNHGVHIVSQVEQQLKAVAESTKASSVSVMNFQDEVPAHLRYPNDVRSLAGNSINSSDSSASAATAKSASRKTKVVQSSNSPWRTARLFISSTFEGSAAFQFLSSHFRQLIFACLPSILQICMRKEIIW